MIMDADANVVLLDELLHARQRLVGGCADDEGYSGSFAVLKFLADVLIVIVRKRDRTTRAQLQASSSVLRCTRRYLIGGRHGQMRVLYVQVGGLQLLHEVDQM